MTFIAMRYMRIDANIVSLSGIAIALGTMVDLGIVLTENMLKHLKAAPKDEKRIETLYRATTEVSGAILTAVATTIVSFIPIFTLEAAEGKLFTPLAWTKSLALFLRYLSTFLSYRPCPMPFWASNSVKLSSSKAYTPYWGQAASSSR